MSQVALAGLIGRSESWVSQVERGVRSVDRVSVLLDMARILHVEVEALVGTTWNQTATEDASIEGMTAIRRAFTVYHMLHPKPTPTGSYENSRIRDEVERGHRLYQAAEYGAVIELLPELIAAADEVHTLEDDSEIRFIYVAVHVLTAKLVTKLGAADLAMLAADRAANMAARDGSLTLRGMAGYQVVCALLRSKYVEEAERVAVDLATRAEQEKRAGDQAEISTTGALWLIAAIIAGRRTDRDEAWRRLASAERLARELGEDGNYAWTAFGPTNVALHRVGVATELGDATEALRVAESLDLNNLPSGLLSRRAQVNLHLAWAQSQRHRDAEAILHLLEAERIAPEVIVRNIVAREVTRELLARASRPRTSALESLAERAGLVPQR